MERIVKLTLLSLRYVATDFHRVSLHLSITDNFYIVTCTHKDALQIRTAVRANLVFRRF